MPRCAIYTRKSTDEGLEQDFNSLDAQREACEAYIRSQKHEGWRLIPEHFDDGGHSGGTMNRPALAHLLEVIKRGQVDVVVVYKVDRLTRALADFAKIVELFDSHGVSFVSVTQQFNTTTSMGRLTLNVLLSFAQFEREVTAERIRDKIAASKKKGIWMGGPPPLGYDVQDRKLVINETEAATVRQIFELYLELRTVQKLTSELSRRGILTKRRLTDKGVSGGKLFTRAALYSLLANPLYIGQMPHKGATYPGQHEAIIDATLWEAVRNRLAENAPVRRSSTNSRSSALLAGLIFDETGDGLTPTHATKNGRRYRYYVSHRLVQGTRNAGDGWRIPAREVERAVSTLIAGLLNDHQRLIEVMDIGNQPAITLAKANKMSTDVAEQLRDIGASAARDAIRQVVRRVDLSRERMALTLDRVALGRMLGVSNLPKTSPRGENVEVSAPITMRRRGVEARLLIQNGNKSQGCPDPMLSRTVAKAHVWFDKLASGEAASVREIARREKVNECDVSWSLRLAFLSPAMVEFILTGNQPIGLNATRLRMMRELPNDWHIQQRLLMHISSRQ